LRVSITGGASGPDLMATMEVLGSEEVTKRIEHALKTIPIK
jgi:glutamyl-tRNA synthetase